MPDHRPQEPAHDPGPQPDEGAISQESYEYRSPRPSDLPAEEATPYYLRRKGSLYNIHGPDGRLFKSYKSAGVVGPRWEELTHTPWPYESSAYAPGTRLWQLGLIPRERVGKTTLLPEPRWPAPSPPPTAEVTWTLPDSGLAQRSMFDAAPTPVLDPAVMPALLPGLPPPGIDLQEQARLLAALRKEPRLLFEPPVRAALEHEVEYHRPEAEWAGHLLDLLHRFERRLGGHADVPTAGEAEPPLPNILDVYRNPLLALHPDRDGLRAMLQEEANDSGVLADFARKLDLVLQHWQEEPERLRGHLKKQAEAVRKGGIATIDPLVDGPQRYRNWRLHQNQARNEQRAARLDAGLLLANHIAWQAEKLARV